LKKVRAGDTLVVLDRDEPVARIERIEKGSTVDDRLVRLEKNGLIRRASKAFDFSTFQELPRVELSVLEALIDERKDGR
jgi:antitoxin (DNA-binding transcriptional repressor) of toxin-antitoxin stability system